MMSHRLAVCSALVLAACSATHGAKTATPPKPATGGLKDAFASAFMIGAALGPLQFAERDTATASLVKREFNAITPENVLKWERVHPQPNGYTFAPADQYVAFGERNRMF